MVNTGGELLQWSPLKLLGYETGSAPYEDAFLLVSNSQVLKDQRLL